MKIIYSNVPPVTNPNESDFSLSDYVRESLPNADMVICAVGYVSKKSLIEFDSVIRNKDYSIKKVILVLGMYYIEGFPESIYNTAMKINREWRDLEIGEIRVTESVKYHGKVYGFYKEEELKSASIGSHNLGSLVCDATNYRQYEISMCTEKAEECYEINDHLQSVISVSRAIDEIDGIKIIREENRKLSGVEGVTKVPMDDVNFYKDNQTDISFTIPLKVPGIPDSNKDYMKSNVNKCYAKGRLHKKTGIVSERGWWETEIIVGKEITCLSQYPRKDEPFYVITDDGWKFLMHVSGDYKKNFESDGDLKILGYWLKGRLVAAGIVEPVDSPAKDLLNINNDLTDIYHSCKGVITYEKLANYGRTSVTLTKTIKTITDESKIKRDVWVLSFLPR